MLQPNEKTVFELELPPTGGVLSNLRTPAESAHYCRVNLDKAENMRVAVVIEIQTQLDGRYNGDKEACREWYEANVVRWEGRYYRQREWRHIDADLNYIKKHGSNKLQAHIDSRREIDAKRDWKAERARGSKEYQEVTKSYSTYAGYSPYQQWLSRMFQVWREGNAEWQRNFLETDDVKKLVKKLAA